MVTLTTDGVPAQRSSSGYLTCPSHCLPLLSRSPHPSHPFPFWTTATMAAPTPPSAGLVVTDYAVHDVRFPTSLTGDGTDASACCLALLPPCDLTHPPSLRSEHFMRLLGSLPHPLHRSARHSAYYASLFDGPSPWGRNDIHDWTRK